MYPYHNRIKQRIKNGELIAVWDCMNYPGIGECKVLVFNTDPIYRPIRPHRYAEYERLIRPYERA